MKTKSMNVPETHSPAKATGVFLFGITAVIYVALFAGSVNAQRNSGEPPKDLEDVDVTEHLGAYVPEDIKIVNEAGDTVLLGAMLHHDKPVILTLGYYECPMLCNLVFNALSKSVAQLKWNAADEFEMLTVSINPNETSQLAAAKKKNYLNDFEKNSGKHFDPAGWTFAVAEGDMSRALANAVGFGYHYDSSTQQYAHPAVTIILTPEGMISRYLYGLDHSQQDLRLALLEASEGRYGSTVDKLILYCFHYDPDSKGYVLFATNVMKLGGGMMVLAFAFFFMVMWLRSRAKRSRLALADAHNDSQSGSNGTHIASSH